MISQQSTLSLGDSQYPFRTVNGRLGLVVAVLNENLNCLFLSQRAIGRLLQAKGTGESDGLFV